jgi:hypothetical protein
MSLRGKCFLLIREKTSANERGVSTDVGEMNGKKNALL